MDYYEKTTKTERMYTGNIINVERVTVLLPDGRTSTRDVVRHMGASAVIPITDSGEIYLVEQYRKPCDMISLEIPAGKLDEGEDPEECAIRELREETGLKTDNIKKAMAIHTTPGFSDEIIHIYVASNLTLDTACPDDDEFITCRKYKVEDLLEMISNGKITDAKTIIGILVADKVIKGTLKI